MGPERRENTVLPPRQQKGGHRIIEKASEFQKKVGVFLKTLWSGKAKEEPHLLVTFGDF